MSGDMFKGLGAFIVVLAILAVFGVWQIGAGIWWIIHHVSIGVTP